MVEKILADIRNGLNRFPGLQPLIRSTDWERWQQLLNAQTDFESYFSKTKFNLLVALLLAGGAAEHPFFTPAARMLTKLETFLKSFPALAADKNFHDKVNNLAGLNFFATMSELSIADHLQRAGYHVQFEKPFKKTGSNDFNDVDVTAWLPGHRPLHIEVYTPNKQAEISDHPGIDGGHANSFFDLDESNESFADVVSKKDKKKFGVEGFTGLEGLCVLAVNLVYVDLIFLQVQTGVLNYSKLQQVLDISPNIQGIILFKEDFAGNASFELVRILYKQ